MHHGERPDSDLIGRMRESGALSADDRNKLDDLFAKIEEAEGGLPEKLGATGQFPQGKLDDSDEGEIRIAVGVSNGKVVINFGKRVAWLAMDGKQARALADSIRQQSYKIKGPPR